MPAARPSQATMKNPLEAALAVGCKPTAVCVAPDGSLRVEFADNCESGPTGEQKQPNAPLRWSDA